MRRNKRNRRGIVLVAVALALMLMIAGLGLGVDLNRLLVEQRSLQSTAESVAVAAALELDGTAAGFERARVRAGNAWLRRQQAASRATLTIEFADSPAGPFTADPLATTELRAARVHVLSSMPLTLLGGVVREKSLPVEVVARAGQQPVERVESGVLPFAVEPDGRFAEGLTLPATGAEAIRQSILKGVSGPLQVGGVLPLYAGEPKIARQVLRDMVRSDSDSTAATYTEYAANGRGNGRRLVLLPVVDGARGRRIAAFAAFLLMPAEGYADDAAVLRAEPAGGYLEGSRYRANAGSGAWRVEVLR